MSQPIAGFVGKPYEDFFRWLRAHGYEVHVFASKLSSYTYSDQVAQVHRLDFSSKKALFAELDALDISPECFVNTYENAVVPKSWLCEYYNLPGLPEDVAQIATDKFRMRSAFAEHCPQYSPKFALVSSWDEIEEFLQLPGVAFPLVLKPTNLFKSLLVTKNADLAELKQSFTAGLETIAEIYAKEGVTFAPRFVLEEYLDGPSYSLEVFADQTGNLVAAPTVVDLVMGRDLGINDNYNYSRKLPSTTTAKQQEELRKAALAGVAAMGIVSSPAHVELVYTAKGPMLIEIGARTGGYRPRIHQLANGLDLMQAQLDVAYGRVPKLTIKKHSYCAVYEVFAHEVGEFVAIENADKVEALESLFYFSIKPKPGTLVGPAKSGFRADALAIFTNGDAAVFQRDTEFFENNVRVLVQSVSASQSQ